jgi:hypothetical protein
VQKFCSLIGKRITVDYRAGEIRLTATGMLAADSGTSIYLEDRFSQKGSEKTLRLGIPYRCIIRLAETGQKTAPVPHLVLDCPGEPPANPPETDS